MDFEEETFSSPFTNLKRGDQSIRRAHDRRLDFRSIDFYGKTCFCFAVINFTQNCPAHKNPGLKLPNFRSMMAWWSVDDDDDDDDVDDGDDAAAAAAADE